MAQSFTFARALAASAGAVVGRRKVLITGAAGRIGASFAEDVYSRYDLRLMVRERDDADAAKRLATWGAVVEADLGDLARLKVVCDGVDTVVHLAGNPDPSATWDELLSSNIVGTYNVMVAAKAAGCRRLIYASSIHAVSGYPNDVQVKTSDPVNPGDLYGVSKCFGEAMGRFMSTQEGLSVLCLRIGAFQTREAGEDPGSTHMMDIYLTRRDMTQMLVRCIDADDALRFAILHAVSDNRFKRLDITDARELVGYEPADDITRLNPKLREMKLEEVVLGANQKDDGQESGIREEVAGDEKRASR